MYPCDINLNMNPTGQRAGCFTPASASAPVHAGLPALTQTTNSFIGVHPNFPRDECHFDPPLTTSTANTTSFTPPRPEHYSSSPTTQSPTAPLSLSATTPMPPTHGFGHQTPWVTQPTGSFPGVHFHTQHTLGDADYDYFAVGRPASSPHSTGRSDISGSPTLGERTPPTSQAALPTKLLSSLSAEQQRIVKDADPSHQQAIMDILTSSDFNDRGDIPAEKLQAFYISVPHVRNEGDKQGSRGGAAGYTCRWQACPQAEADRPIKRRDHMLNHIRGHFGVKPFGCKFGNGVNLPRCMARFLRADDLKRHVRTVHSKDVDNQFNIVELDPKKQSKSKRGVADIPEPQRGRGYQPYSTGSPHHRRSTSDVDAVADYDLSQLPQAQPPAFFTHGQGQSTAAVQHGRLWLVSPPWPIRDLGAVEDSAMGRPLKSFAEQFGDYSALSGYENGSFQTQAHDHAHDHAHANFSA